MPPGGNLSVKDKVPPARCTGASSSSEGPGGGCRSVPGPAPRPRPPPSPARLSPSETGETRQRPRTQVPGGDEVGSGPGQSTHSWRRARRAHMWEQTCCPDAAPSRRGYSVTAGHRGSASPVLLETCSGDGPWGRKQGGGGQHTEAAGRTLEDACGPTRRPHEHSLPSGQCRCPGRRPLSPVTLSKADPVLEIRTYLKGEVLSIWCALIRHLRAGPWVASQDDPAGN